MATSLNSAMSRSLVTMSKLQMMSGSSRILTDVACSVCRDNSSGKHYGIYACDGCAGFFKRSIRRSRQYQCKSRSELGCPVDKTHRNQCRACRLNKCIQAGMNRDAVQHERGPRNATVRRQMTPLYDKTDDDDEYNGRGELGSGPAGSLSGQGDQEAACYWSGRVTCSPAGLSELKMPRLELSASAIGTSGAAAVGGTQQLTSKYAADVTSHLDLAPPQRFPATACMRLSAESLCEAAARLLFMTVKWVKNVPAFVALPFRDQVALLVEGWTELFVLGAAQFQVPFDAEALVNNTDTPASSLPANDSDPAAGCSIRDPTKRAKMAAEIRTLQEIIGKFQSIRVDQTEYACLKGIVLFKTVLCDHPTLRPSPSPTPSPSAPPHALQDLEAVAALQDQAQMALCRYVRARYPVEPMRFGKLLLMLPSLKAVSPQAVVELFFKKAIGNIPLERLLVDMYKSADI